ncbi:MAG: glycosyltransferase family 2 protein [Thiopseudomonas sp.]|nr:glycosyltransferase family 2 protein [Thiopseudomonas sp.]MCK9464764.1 glycosyltransferase family 2 protein [Thiopseudomonas sp.]
MNISYSIVIPVYKSETIIPDTISQVISAMDDLSEPYEVILVNDGSPDGAWSVIKGLAEKYNSVVAINLIKNYGQHNAVHSGFAHAKGSYIITMDDDLQNPPSELKHLINKIKNSEYDLVFGKFREKKHAAHRRMGSKIIGYLNKKVFKKPDNITLTNFRIVKREVIERVLRHKTPYPYIPGLLLLYASNVGNVFVEHHERDVGSSNYTLPKILSLVSRLLINYSSYPLRLLSRADIWYRCSLVSCV